MSSRDDRRRRERSWERDARGGERVRGGHRDEDKDRDRRVGDYRGAHSSGGRRRDDRSRSRSPRRDDRRGYERERGHDRRGGRDRPRDDRRDYERDDKRDSSKRDHERERDHGRDYRSKGRTEVDKKLKTDDRLATSPGRTSSATVQPPPKSSGGTDSVENDQGESGEELEPMDAQDEDTDMMAMMGFGGFDTTKGKPVQGNQEGAVSIKKPRTWRQYMNRRGGFNRPLDKIK